LRAMAEALGPERPAVVARELTKHFEEFRRDSLAGLAAHYEATGAPKGEIVVCVGPPGEEEEAIDPDALLRRLASEMPAARAAGEAARMTGLPRAELYRRLMTMKDEGS